MLVARSRSTYVGILLTILVMNTYVKMHEIMEKNQNSVSLLYPFPFDFDLLALCDE
jgi:hypothetical protein